MKEVISRVAAPINANMIIDAITLAIYDNHVATYGQEPIIASERVVQGMLDGTYAIETVTIPQVKQMRQNYYRDYQMVVRYYGTIDDNNLNEALDEASHNLQWWLRYIDPPSEIITSTDTITGEILEETIHRRLAATDVNSNKDGDNAAVNVYVTYRLHLRERESHIRMRTLDQNGTIKKEG